MDFDVRVQDGHHVGGRGSPPGGSGERESLLLVVPHSSDAESRVLLLDRLHVAVEVALQVL